MMVPAAAVLLLLNSCQATDRWSHQQQSQRCKAQAVLQLLLVAIVMMLTQASATCARSGLHQQQQQQQRSSIGSGSGSGSRGSLDPVPEQSEAVREDVHAGLDYGLKHGGSPTAEEKKGGIHIYSPEPVCLPDAPRNEHIPDNAAPGNSLPDAFKDRDGADVVAAHYRQEQADLATANATNSTSSGDNGTTEVPAAVAAAGSSSSGTEAVSDTAHGSLTKCESNGAWLEPSVTEGHSNNKHGDSADEIAGSTSTE
eukprot:7550-Heterococcus_DN1.PRE.2